MVWGLMVDGRRRRPWEIANRQSPIANSQADSLGSIDCFPQIDWLVLLRHKRRNMFSWQRRIGPLSPSPLLKGRGRSLGSALAWPVSLNSMAVPRPCRSAVAGHSTKCNDKDVRNRCGLLLPALAEAVEC